jgi:transcription-repair coupling factor (superfamily II helicase)
MTTATVPAAHLPDLLDPLARQVDQSDIGRSLDALLRAGQPVAELGGLRAAARALLLALLARRVELPLLWVTPTHTEAERLLEDAQHYLGLPVVLDDAHARQPHPYAVFFPERDMSLFDEGAADPERLRVLGDLATGQPVIVIAPVLSLLQRTASPRTVQQEALTLERGQEIDFDTLLAALVERGYERTVMVEHRGQFSRRGGILDIYPASGEAVRIEFFGDEIDQMRTFNVDTQLSVQPMQSVQILGMREAEHKSYLTEYLPKDALIVMEEPARLKLRVEEMAADAGASPPSPAAGRGPNGQDEGDDDTGRTGGRANRYSRYAGIDILQHEVGTVWGEVLTLLGTHRRLDIKAWGATERSADLFIETEPVQSFASRLEEFMRWAERQSAARETLVVVSHQAHRVHDILARQDPHLVCRGELNSGTVCVFSGSLSEGFRLPSLQLTVVTDRELFSVTRRRKYATQSERGSTLRLEDLKEGDAVVHLQHGIGRFDGLTKLKIQGSEKDFLKLTYAKGDSLFVPVEQMGMVSKYVGLEGDTLPTLSRLGRGEWQKTRAKITAEVAEMTQKLLALYAERRAGKGHRFGPDTPWQDELEAAFPYDETPDQLKAIETAKADMESDAVMDRLICGDVGYGKTEVALRAAFKAVMEGTQVAVLVPTTILAQQHHQTFKQRMEPFPVRVEVMSRFRSEKEQRAVVAGLKEGTVDLVIGTHRLLQKDIEFKNLGLIVVDEEQHFGVAHKERLKELFAHVDALTMTATPIPRTLQMSLLGVRDLSLIETPPEARLPIKTYLFEYSKDVVAGAITRELERDGQVFYLHNRVRGIEKVAQEIRDLVPGARVIVGHGQMSEDRLEKVIMDFIDGQYDVLVCTTIIESGVDMPNVNTMLIHNAHMFGLGQLYQLRGRVGRTDRQAYCYLLYPPHRSLTPEAEKRLETIREFTALGSGYQIAMRDLEIRGAGNLLGPQQSGHIAAVGFSLYCQMLEEAVAEARGTSPERPRAPLEGPVIELPVEAFLPDDYVQDARQKITLYRRMADMTDDAQVDELAHELRDRFGALPESVENLLVMVRLRLAAVRLGVPSIKFRESYEARAIVCLMPFVNEPNKLQLQRLAELTEARVVFKDRQMVLTGLGPQERWPGALLRGFHWIEKHLQSN